MTRYIARFSVGKCLSIEMHRNNEKMKKMKKMKNEKKRVPLTSIRNCRGYGTLLSR